MKFESLSLCEPLLRALREERHEQATPIQQQAIPHVLRGQDLVGCAQTGTGKTAAFALPTLQRLLPGGAAPVDGDRKRRGARPRPIRALVLVPTRELAAQIGDRFNAYGRFTGLRHTVIFGGVGQTPQVRAIQQGVDILIATPGRLLDLMNQGFVRLGDVEVLVLDEADQMLDMGFIHDLRKIVSHVPRERQTLLFSATMPPAIRQLASQWLNKPAEVHVAPVASTPELVKQTVYFVDRPKKVATLTRLLRDTARARTLVFSRTKRGADRIAKGLERAGIRAVSIHGDKSQSKRESVIRLFNSKQPPVLVATDLAARGLDFSGISHVINYDLPEVPETYVHRIGRTARAGTSGEAISLCDQEERHLLRSIEKLTGRRVAIGALSQPLDAERESTVTDAVEPSVRTSQRQPRGERSRSSRRDKDGAATAQVARKTTGTSKRTASQKPVQPRCFGEGIFSADVETHAKPRRSRQRSGARVSQANGNGAAQEVAVAKPAKRRPRRRRAQQQRG